MVQLSLHRLIDVVVLGLCSQDPYREPVTRYIQFPFVIRNESLPTSCGYPGFDLLCDDDYNLLINLPNSGVFSVEEIDYVNQELWLNDPDDCLPRKLLTLNDSNYVGKSPFIPVLEQVYWFYNCSSDFFNSSDDDEINPISCLSGQSYGVFATQSKKIVKGNSSLCNKIGPVKVPVSKKSNEMYSSLELEDDILLTWSKPLECGECYQRNGNCLSRPAMFAIAVAFVTPLVLVTCCIAYFIMRAICYRRRANRARLPSAVLALSMTPQPQRVIQGLDQTIIESYPKVVLGESRRLPKPDDNNCAICLSEYLAKETLKTIPDCGHCFHAHCIDEWLLLNASCPVCRNSPSKTPQSNAS
ncbi:putative RING-H2 finger protein ATL21A [Bienertia sinuspersici]